MLLIFYIAKPRPVLVTTLNSIGYKNKEVYPWLNIDIKVRI